MSNSREDLEQKIIEKAMKDDEFRAHLKNDPKAAIEETLGIKLPDGVNFHINEESVNDVHITLPPKVNDEELSNEELSGVSGGWAGPCLKMTSVINLP